MEIMRALIDKLNAASDAYYNTDSPILTDYEWDKLYDELVELEKRTGIIEADSPTQNVGYAVENTLEDVVHNHPMLSLDKCHSAEELVAFAGDKDCVLSVKCDGLTTTLEYDNGVLISAETRGDGVKGTNVLANVLTIKNVPKKIPYKDRLTIDGEAIIDYVTFAKINDSLPKDIERYKHPRNLASGTLIMKDTEIVASREMRFIAWRVIRGFEEEPFVDSFFSKLKAAEKLGFEIVPMWTYSNNSSDKSNIQKMLDNLKTQAEQHGIPYDGAVMTYDSLSYGESLGCTGKFPRHSIAYKYEDELYETELTDIEWKTSRTGLINPTAVFKPVVMDGADTSRATLHNVSYIENLMLGIGDRIRVYKANAIIPKVHDSLTQSGTYMIPDKCPCCGTPTEIHNENGSKTLHCTNPDCDAKLLSRLIHFCSKKCLDIDGLSEATLEKFYNLGWIHNFKDIFHLNEHYNEMIRLDGFGKKSADNLMVAIEKARHCTLDRFICALGIPLIGTTASKAIAKFEESRSQSMGARSPYEAFIDDIESKLMWEAVIEGLGGCRSHELRLYCTQHMKMLDELAKEFVFDILDAKSANAVNTPDLSGNTFCITGSLNHFSNRDELKGLLESMGAKVAGSVSAKTTALINNDNTSGSSKNVKAKSLDIPILTEEEFLNKYIKREEN